MNPPSVADQAVKARIREFQRTVDDEFINAWEEFTARRKVLITLDPFDGLASNELGRWLVRLALRLPRTVTVLARAPSEMTFAPGDARMRRLELPYFTVDEVSTYLEQRFPDEHLYAGIAKAVHDYTDGHPGGTELAAKLIQEKGSDIEARELRRILDRLPEDPEERWGSLVRLIVDAVHDSVLRKAVDAASVALTFDEPLLAALLDLDPAQQGAGDALAALRQHRLVQAVPGDVRRNRFRLLEFIRVSLAKELRVTQPSQWDSLHAQAAEHYFELLQKDEAEYPGGSYGQWYRYEQPEWQANKEDWLYHSGQLRERNALTLTRARFVLVFLEAFWWWGCYEPFPFNQRLLEDWERATVLWEADSGNTKLIEDQQLAEALWFVLDNYPVGYIKKAAPWEEMESRLLLVRRLCGLAPGTSLPPDRDERRQLARARAILAVFLAHTRRYRDPADTKADRYYGEALQTFQKLKDDWVAAWLLFETADLALERGQPEKAVPMLGKSAALALEFTLSKEENGEGTKKAADDFDFGDDISGDWDYELLANLHRARADAYWMCGEVDQAAVEYGRAVAAAYWFQGQPHPPDAYTHRFYEEITSRAAERVCELSTEHRDGAVHFAMSMCAQQPAPAAKADAVAATKSGQAADVSKALFPRGPDCTTELGELDTPFMNDWLQLWDDRSDPAEELAAMIGEAGST